MVNSRTIRKELRNIASSFFPSEMLREPLNSLDPFILIPVDTSTNFGLNQERKTKSAKKCCEKACIEVG